VVIITLVLLLSFVQKGQRTPLSGRNDRAERDEGAIPMMTVAPGQPFTCCITPIFNSPSILGSGSI
jgi:hypothetical protein